MDVFGWERELSTPRNADVHRRLTIDRRNYEVVAYCCGDGLVALRVTGWDAEHLVTELTGEIPAADAFDVGNLVASALGGFRDDPPPPPAAPTRPPHDWWAARPTAPNAGKPWEPQDLEVLMARFREGASVKTLTAELGRTEGGIRSRLQLLGAFQPDPDPADGGPPGDVPEGPAAGEEGEHMPVAG